jgi:chemotaxis protein histidine kinase CheA
MPESDLLQMLATETDRRAPTITDGVKKVASGSEPDREAIEQVRVEVHGLKGAAGVVGQSRLAELALAIEVVLVQRIASGEIPEDLAGPIVAGAEALREGAQAAADGKPEPASVADALAALNGLTDD